MDEKFLLGIVLGMVGGAVLVTNSVKVRQKIKEKQHEIKQKVTDLTNDGKESK